MAKRKASAKSAIVSSAEQMLRDLGDAGGDVETGDTSFDPSSWEQDPEDCIAQDDPVDVARTVHHYETSAWHIPGPTGIEFPHVCGRWRCAADHKLWIKQGATLAGLRRYLNEQLSENSLVVRPEQYDAWLFSLAKEEPDYAEWERTERKCIAQYKARQSKKSSAVTDRSIEAERRRQAIVDRVDLGSSEFLDAAYGGEGTPAARKARAKKAREQNVKKAGQRPTRSTPQAGSWEAEKKRRAKAIKTGRF